MTSNIKIAVNTISHSIDTPSSNRSRVLKNVLLTERERQVLRTLSQGFTSKEIGRLLSISKHTVESHKKNLLDKLGAKNTAHLIAISFSNGLIK